MAIKNLTSGEFDSFVKTGVSVIDLYTNWCGPCKILSPIVEEVANEIKNVKFAKIDVDKEQELAQRFDVMSVPTLIFFKGKEQIDRVVGVVSKEELVKTIKKIAK